MIGKFAKIMITIFILEEKAIWQIKKTTKKTRKKIKKKKANPGVNENAQASPIANATTVIKLKIIF